MIIIKGYIEKRTRGLKGFPFEIYRDKGSRKGMLIASAHYHNELEIMLPKKGITDLAVEGETINAYVGQAYIINPNEVHAMYTNTESYYYAIVFPKELICLSGESIVNSRIITPLFEGKLKIKRQINDSLSLELLSQTAELYSDTLKNAPLILSNLYKLLWHFEQCGYFYGMEETERLPIHRAIDYMENHFAEKITLADIAGCAGMSSKYFCSYFKKHTLTTAISYLNALRIQKACQLLENKRSVTDTALSCGFDNISFFIKKFKEAVGVTPAKYAKTK